MTIRQDNLNIPKFTLPHFISRLGEHLPQWPHAIALTAALNAGVMFKILPKETVALLEDKQFLIRVEDAGGYAAFTFKKGYFRPLFRLPETPDLTFSAKFATYAQLAFRQEDPDTLFFNRELSVEGDTELGLIVKNMLDAVEWPRFSDFRKRHAY